MLAPEDWTAWLGTPEQRKALLRPFPADAMTMWPVTAAVGSVRNTGAELVEPIQRQV
jgi:putative SOS response-associated peptidase YedK